jgi:hypothetical protein
MFRLQLNQIMTTLGSLSAAGADANAESRQGEDGEPAGSATDRGAKAVVSRSVALQVV